jgi:hypothetical protein
MSKNKGKPSGKYAQDKNSPGRKGDYQRSGWPEDAPTQRVGTATNQQQSPKQDEPEPTLDSGFGRGRDRKAGSPV